MEKQTIARCTVQALQQAEAAVIIDVRSPGEFAALHVAGAINIPLDTCTDAALLALPQVHSAEAVYVLCQSGQRAQMACNKLADQAVLAKLQIVEGGMSAWPATDADLVRGKGAISLERQVRIVAGFLVALGVGLGYWVHPGFLGLAGFVGLGLMFAGITDFCGMGLVLAKMPWNQAAKQKTSCSIQ